VTKKDSGPFLGMTGKDWITIPLALLAFVISAGSAYFNIVQKVEHVSVIARYAPIVRKHGDALTVRPDEHRLIFVNSGNRPISIVSVEVIFMQHKDRQTSDCDLYGAAASGRFETDVQPFVVKENEVLITVLKIGARHPYGERRVEDGTDTLTFPIIDEMKGQKYIPVEVCLDVELATPSLRYHSKRVSIFRYDVHDGGMFLGDDIASEYKNAPSLLIDRKITIFDR
jgi:hypothetical protein